MTTDLTVQKLQQSLKAKTLSDLVRVKTSDNAMLLLDSSSSMLDTMRNGKTREQGLREVVKEITQDRSVKMIAFGGEGAWETTSVPHPSGGTPLHQGIDLAKQKNASKIVVVSDGMPNDRSAALESAKNFGGVIDVVFVGDPGEPGEEFLRQLAASTGGTEFHGDLGQPKELGGQIMGLLGGGEDDEDEPRKAVQL